MRAGRRPEDIEILAAVKYVGDRRPPRARGGGDRRVGENKTDALLAKQAAYGGPSPGTSSAISRAGRHATSSTASAGTFTRIRFRRRSDRAPGGAPQEFSSRSTSRMIRRRTGCLGRARPVSRAARGFRRIRVRGLMTMPPFVHRPRGVAAFVRPAPRSLLRHVPRMGADARVRRPVDGNEPGLRRGRRGGGHDRPARLCAVRALAGELAAAPVDRSGHLLEPALEVGAGSVEMAPRRLRSSHGPTGRAPGSPASDASSEPEVRPTGLPALHGPGESRRPAVVPRELALEGLLREVATEAVEADARQASAGHGVLPGRERRECGLELLASRAGCSWGYRWIPFASSP